MLRDLVVQVLRSQLMSSVHQLIKHTYCVSVSTYMPEIVTVFQSPTAFNMINLKSPVVKGIILCFIHRISLL